jgi:hypothetical protein
MTSEKVDSPIPFAAVVLLLRFLTELALLAGLAVAGARLGFVLFAGVGVALAVTGLLVAGIVLAVVGIGLAAATRALPK